MVDAALRCVARWGMAKTTLDDVAREAGCGRATLYRFFPGGRDALWDAVVAVEAERFCVRIAERVGSGRGLEDCLVAMINESARALTQHEALRFLVEHEPEAILPHLAFHRMDAVLRHVSAVGAPLLAPWVEPADDFTLAETAARAVEWVARIVLSYVTSPANGIDLCDEVSTRHLVRAFIMPGLQPAIDLPA